VSDDRAASILAEARRIARTLETACRNPGKTPDFTACGGPAAEAYWEYFTPARISSLVAAIEALSSALGKHRQTFTDSRGISLCGGCLRPDCPDDPEAIIARALGGTEAGDGK
jgi:hypothetical protein